MPFGAVAAAVGPALASAAVGVAGSAIGSALSSGSSSGGAAQAQGISQAAIDQADTQRQADRAAFQPFVDQGTTGATALGNLLGLNGADAAKAAMSGFTASPGYDYQLQQGLRAVDAGAAARGMGRSGATLKAEQTLGNNLANQDFGNYLTRLTSLAGLGLQGAQGQAGTTQTFNSLLNGQTTNQASSAYGAGVNNASIYGNGISGITSGLQSSGVVNKLFGSGTTGQPFDETGSGSFSGAGRAPTPADFGFFR